ncbi:gpi anchored cell wall protein [Rutstroemia sp. NJR-2017a WRK4]|nr:gpi anchored cell wall protein [Rutstroemia sp. NJR-2017a WRK4]
MYTPAIVLTTLLTLVSATPPACLLAAINEQPEPSDLKAICGTLESSVAGNITEKCSGNAYSGAVSAYEATCLSSAGVTVSITSSASSSSGTGSASATTTATGSAGAKISGSANATGSSAASGSKNSSVSATGSSAAASATNGAEGLAVPGLMAIIGLAGVMML